MQVALGSFLLEFRRCLRDQNGRHPLCGVGPASQRQFTLKADAFGFRSE